MEKRPADFVKELKLVFAVGTFIMLMSLYKLPVDRFFQTHLNSTVHGYVAQITTAP